MTTPRISTVEELPHQWEGQLADGRRFCVQVRIGGSVSIGIGRSALGAKTGMEIVEDCFSANGMPPRWPDLEMMVLRAAALRSQTVEDLYPLLSPFQKRKRS